MRPFFVTLVSGVFFVTLTLTLSPHPARGPFHGGVGELWAQVGVIPETPAPPADSPVGVIPESEEEDVSFPQVIIKITGEGCEINLNEAEMLRTRGVLAVDVEKIPGKMIIEYDPTVVTKQAIREAVGKKEGGCVGSESDMTPLPAGELEALKAKTQERKEKREAGLKKKEEKKEEKK